MSSLKFKLRYVGCSFKILLAHSARRVEDVESFLNCDWSNANFPALPLVETENWFYAKSGRNRSKKSRCFLEVLFGLETGKHPRPSPS